MMISLFQLKILLSYLKAGRYINIFVYRNYPYCCLFQAFKHLIVGFTQRKHIESPENSGKFIYGKRFTKENCCYSIILTTSAMFHVQYLELYNSFMTEEMRSFIDQNMNCEDLFMNAVVGKHLKDTVGLSCPGLLLQQYHVQRMEKKNGKAQIQRCTCAMLFLRFAQKCKCVSGIPL